MAKKAKAKKTTKKSAKKKPAAKRTSKAKAMEVLYIASKVKARIKEHNLNVAGDALEGLNKVIHWHIEQATQRATANGRKTVRSHDFLA